MDGFQWNEIISRFPYIAEGIFERLDDQSLTTVLGRAIFFARGLIFEGFSTLGMKKFPYLKTGPFGNPIFPIAILVF